MSLVCSIVLSLLMARLFVCVCLFFVLCSVFLSAINATTSWKFARLDFKLRNETMPSILENNELVSCAQQPLV